jgi:hypothetical protein
MQSALLAGEAGKGGGIDVLIGFLGIIEKRRYSGQSLALVLARAPGSTLLKFSRALRFLSSMMSFRPFVFDINSKSVLSQTGILSKPGAGEDRPWTIDSGHPVLDAMQERGTLLSEWRRFVFGSPNDM